MQTMKKIFIGLSLILTCTAWTQSHEVEVTDIRTANQIFVEHSGFKKTIDYQKLSISYLTEQNSLLSVNVNLLEQKITNKDSLSSITKLQHVQEIELKNYEIKQQKKKTTNARIFSAGALSIAIIILLIAT